MALGDRRARIASSLLSCVFFACSPRIPYRPGEARKAVDFHTHVSLEALSVADDIFQRAGISLAVNLSARPWGPGLAELLHAVEGMRTKMLIFTGIDWRNVYQPDFGSLAAEDLRRAVAAGVRGLKVSKALGLRVPRRDGSLMVVDDPRLDPLWRAAGELGVPVAIHTGDPLAFFQAPTPSNERYAELKDHPGWSFFGPQFPTLPQLMEARDRLVARHPRTTFVGVHVGGFPENLKSVAASMRANPNLWIDIAARIPEIGRIDPEQVRAFFVEFQDRILFGTDLQVSRSRIVLGSAGDDEIHGVADAVGYYEVHWRYLETRERKMEHATPIQGTWTIDGIGLDRSVLEKVYGGNARRLLRLVDRPSP